MPTIPQPGELLGAIQRAATNSIGKDVSTIQGFARDQVERIEALAMRLIRMIRDGEFQDDPEEIEVFAKILADLVTNFVHALKGLTIVAIENAWNAIVDALWNAIDTATGITLPRP